MKIPCTKKPCNNCPFRKDTLKGWLGESRIKEILDSDSFVCHKNTKLQCSGHMLLKKESNVFYRTMRAFKIEGIISGEELVFESEEKAIKHHTNHYRK